MIVTKDLLKAMKLADRAYIHCSEKEKIGILTLVAKTKNAGYEFEAKQEVKVEHTFCIYSPYGRQHPGEREDYLRSYFSIPTFGSWQALLLILRDSDDLSFFTMGECQSETMKEAGFVHDALHVEIKRKNETIVRHLSLADEILPVNSRIRAIQNDGPKANAA